MGLTKLGIYIEQTDIRNDDLHFNEGDVKGISTTKQFIETKADLLGVSLKSYKVIRTNEFVYVADTSRRGDKIGLAYCENKPCIVSSIYTSFRVKDESKLLPRFLMMFFNRNEFDRYTRFNSWGSARETFTWEDMCDITLDLPPIEIQKKYVAIYEGLLANLRSYESKLEELKLVCDGYIEDLRKKYHLEPIFDKLAQRIEKNDGLTSKDMYGIGLNGIIPPNQERSDDSIKKCLKFYKGDLLYAPSSFKNGVIVYNDRIDVGLITEEYRVFYVKDNVLNPQYLLMWLKRSELGRYIDFYTMDSVRNRFQFDELNIVNIPIPPLEIQNSIVEVFNVYNERKEYVNRLKKIIKDICPLLVRGAIKEASEVK